MYTNTFSVGFDSTFYTVNHVVIHCLLVRCLLITHPTILCLLSDVLASTRPNNILLFFFYCFSNIKSKQNYKVPEFKSQWVKYFKKKIAIQILNWKRKYTIHQINNRIHIDFSHWFLNWFKSIANELYWMKI